MSVGRDIGNENAFRSIVPGRNREVVMDNSETREG